MRGVCHVHASGTGSGAGRSDIDAYRHVGVEDVLADTPGSFGEAARRVELDDKQLAFAERQSSRANVSRRELTAQQWLRKAGQLVDARGTDNYRAAADILADLREASGGDEGEKITRKRAAHLTKTHPTLNVLKSSLRKRGLLG